MRSVFNLAPATGTLAEVLSMHAEFLVQLNSAWLRDKVARRLDPPCCTHCAEPPWVTRPVRYVPFHGTPTGDTRDYLDGPTMFARGKATCIDIASYDVAALRVLKSKTDARVVLIGGPVQFHALVYCDGETTDPSRKIALRDNVARTIGINVGGCGCSGGVQ